MSLPRLRAFAVAAVVLVAAVSVPASAQGAAKANAARANAEKPNGQALAGAWAGTVTVQLGDSTINAPVMYTFVETGGVTNGTAMVPGQGSGPISNVVRSGAGVKFRVTAKQGAPGKEVLRLLEHDGTIAGDGVFSGVVSLDGKMIAKFRITPRK